MEKINIIVSEILFQKIDQAAKNLEISKSEFCKKAIVAYLESLKKNQDDERKHREGYIKYPVKDNEFSVNEKDRGWGD